MPDLTIHAALVCRSAVGFSAEIDGHRVTFGPSTNGRYQYDWSCDCKGFQFRKTCRHIVAAKAIERCRWNEEMNPWADADRSEGGPCCPVCGGPVVGFNVGV